jgi:hypothetical protein
MRHAEDHHGYWRPQFWVPRELQHAVDLLPAPHTGKKKLHGPSTGIRSKGGDSNRAQRLIDDWEQQTFLPLMEDLRAAMRGEPAPKVECREIERFNPDDGKIDSFFFYPHDRLPPDTVSAAEPRHDMTKSAEPVYSTADVMLDWNRDRGDNVAKQRAIDAKEKAMEEFFAFINKPDNLLRVTVKDALHYTRDSGVKRHSWDEVHALFGLAEKEKMFLDTGGNPFAGISGPKERTTAERRALTEPMARDILLASRASPDPAVLWGHDLCAALGTITSEIADALVAHVIDDDDGILCLEITPKGRKTVLRGGKVQRLDRLKTKARTRLLPIPTRLKDRFIARVAYIRENYGVNAPLFPEVAADGAGSRSHEVGRRMLKVMRDPKEKGGLGIKNEVDADDGFKTLWDARSWRKRWTTLIHKTGVIPGSDGDRWRAMAGHGGVDIHATFYLEHPPRETLLILDALPDPTIDKR